MKVRRKWMSIVTSVVMCDVDIDTSSDVDSDASSDVDSDVSSDVCRTSIAPISYAATHDVIGALLRQPVTWRCKWARWLVTWRCNDCGCKRCNLRRCTDGGCNVAVRGAAAITGVTLQLAGLQ